MIYKQENTSERIKIVIIWQADYPWDIRIEKQIKSFSEKEWESHIVCRNVQNKVSYENKGLVHYWRFNNIGKISGLYNPISFPIYINPMWNWHIESVIKKINPDIVMVRDLPLAISAINLAKKYKIFSIADIAEHYPALIKAVPQKYGKNPIARFLLYKLNWYEYIEKKTIRNSDFVFVVTKEQKERFIRDYGVSADKITIVGNTPDIELDESALQNNLYEDDVLKIIYTGRLENFRGLDTVIEAANLLKDRKVKFTIVGYGDEEHNIKEKISNYNLSNVDFLGYMPQNQLYDLIKSHHVGIIPHLKSDLTDYTLPNKLFDYMAMAKPILASDMRPVKRILEQENCGYTYKSGDPFSLKDKIIRILNEKDLLQSKGANGFNAVKCKYKWKLDANLMQDTITKFTRKDKV